MDFHLMVCFLCEKLQVLDLVLDGDNIIETAIIIILLIVIN